MTTRRTDTAKPCLSYPLMTCRSQLRGQHAVSTTWTAMDPNNTLQIQDKQFDTHSSASQVSCSQRYSGYLCGGVQQSPTSHCAELPALQFNFKHTTRCKCPCQLTHLSGTICPADCCTQAPTTSSDIYSLTAAQICTYQQLPSAAYATTVVPWQ